MASVNLPAHKHTLFFLDTTQLFATRNIPFWGCDACWRTSAEMQVTHSFRCMSCDFDICEECSEPIKSNAHAHTLVATDASSVYPNGAWGCDNCGDDYRNHGPISWHCKNGCYFDLCFGCTRSRKSAVHPHPLLKSNPKSLYPQESGWQCDLCSTLFTHEDRQKPYNCKECSFDLCPTCLKVTIVSDSSPAVVETPEPTSVHVALTDGSSTGSSTEDEGKVAQVFLSYNWGIQDRVLELKRNLESLNIKCWMDTGNMVGGDDLKREIDKGMRGAKIVISCVTKAYSQSNACQQEVALADVLKKPILPVLFESITWPPEGPMAMPFAPLIYVSFADGLTKDNLDKVVKTIKSRTGMKG